MAQRFKLLLILLIILILCCLLTALIPASSPKQRKHIEKTGALNEIWTNGERNSQTEILADQLPDDSSSNHDNRDRISANAIQSGIQKIIRSPKDTLLPGRMEIDSIQIRSTKKTLPYQSFLFDEKDTPHSLSTLPTQTNTGWLILMHENFEGEFPKDNNWDLDWNTSEGEAGMGYTWDDVKNSSHTGNWSCWCCDNNYEGLQDLDPPGPYRSNVNAWMTYGPFSLKSAYDAELCFYYWNESEKDYDYFGWYASINGINFYGYRVSGEQREWTYQNFDLTKVPHLGNFCGHTSVYVAFIFKSDYSLCYEGAYVDDISLKANYSPVLPNLLPVRRENWDDKIVVSDVKGTHTNDTNLFAGNPIYVDYAYLNDSSEDICTRFRNNIFIDDAIVFTSRIDTLEARCEGYGEDRTFTILVKG